MKKEYNHLYYLKNKDRILEKARQKREAVPRKERPKLYKIPVTRIRSNPPKKKLNQYVYNEKKKGKIRGKLTDEVIVRDDMIILPFD
jgi:hypothetical protein